MKSAIKAVLVLLAIAAAGTAMLISRESNRASPPLASPVDEAEQSRAIEALRPGTTARPVIAIVTNNEGTEVADLLSTFGVLRQADVADVVVVAEKQAPVR